MEKNFQDLLATRQPKVGTTLFISVDGHGGSGKSTFAELLSKTLNASTIHTDDFASWDNPRDWQPLLIEKVFKPIIDGAKTISYPRSKWWDNHNPEPIVDQPVTSIMILEGVSSSQKLFREYLSLSIFVDTPKEICLKRGLERDSGTGKPKEEIEQLWKKWYEEEEKYMREDNPKEYADIIIDGTKPFEEQILF